MKLGLTLLSLLLSFQVFAKVVADKIVVYKHERKIQLFKGEELLREYRMKLSIAHNNPLFDMGPKRLRGDMRTPEGTYKVVKKRKNTRFPLSLLINYPNKEDIAWGKKNGYSKYELGDMILIHGFASWPNHKIVSMAKKLGIEKSTVNEWSRKYFYPYFDWTLGCMAVNDLDMKEIFESVEEGTPVIIKRYENERLATMPHHLEAYPPSYY